MSKYFKTQLLRLRPGQVIHRNANSPEIWDQVVALAKLMPHLEVTGSCIARKQNLPDVKLVVSNRVRDIVLPHGGRYTLREIWNVQTEPRPTFASFASSFGMYARLNPHLVTKVKSGGYTTWIVLPDPRLLADLQRTLEGK